MILSVKTDTSYRVVKNEENLGELETAMTLLLDSTTHFAQDCMLLPQKKVEEKYGSTWHAELGNFAKLQPVVGSVATVIRRLLAMRAAAEKDQ